MTRYAPAIALAVASTLAGAVLVSDPARAQEDPSVARTREQVQMLDDLYKTAVVLITEHYVDSPSTLSAASAAKALFAAMSEQGWHDVRLVGLTDTLINAANAPADPFEEAAAQRLLAGETSHEAVVSIDGTRHLRYATPVPVVMDKCVMCHAHYEGESGPIGSLSYTIPLID